MIQSKHLGPHNSHYIYSLFFFLSFFIITNRGVLELIFDKQISYFIQAAIWALYILSLHINSDFKYKMNLKLQIVILSSILYIASMLISSIITYHNKSFGYLWIYLLVSFYFLFLLISSSSVNTIISNKVNYSISISIVTLYISIFGFLEQLSIINTMPGSWHVLGLIRPSSTFGSMQHYAITTAMLSFVNMEFYMTMKNKFYLFIASISALASLFSFTRSGAMIILIGLCIYFIFIFYNSILTFKISKINFYILFFTTLLILFVMFYFYESKLIERIFSSLDTNELGNSFRINAWMNGLSLWFDSNILFGSYTGYITNSTNRLSSGLSYVVESSFVQQLLNFGLFGTVSFYSLLIMQYFLINEHHIFLKSCVISSILQTLVFQSIETIPFMVIITIIPLLSNNLYNQLSIRTKLD